MLLVFARKTGMDTKTVSTVIKEKAMEMAWEEECEETASLFEHIVKDDRKHHRVLEDSKVRSGYIFMEDFRECYAERYFSPYDFAC